MPPGTPSGRGVGTVVPTRRREGFWPAPASRRSLFYQIWYPVQPKALLIIVHGFGEHGGRYATLAEELATEGIMVAVPDLWGHGHSGGTRGDADSLTTYLRDLEGLTRQVFLPESGGSHAIVYGHSFGGLLAIHWALSRVPELQRLIVQSPLLAVGFPVAPWRVAVARWLDRLWPSATLPMRLDAQALSHDPSVVEAYRADPLVHQRISARIYHAILRGGETAQARAHTIDVPTLLLYGEEDHVISIDAVRRWHSALTCQTQVVGFPHAYHELHHEPVRAEVSRLIREWTLPS